MMELGLYQNPPAAEIDSLAHSRQGAFPQRAVSNL